MVRSRDEKQAYFAKLKDYIETYPSIFVVNVDNVGSNQMHQIRQAVRGRGTILMGKNTMVRRAIRLILADHPDFERFLPLVKGNVGFVFTSADLKEIRDVIISNKVAAPAKAGAFAPNDIYVPAGNTGMEPGKTSFFQALNIPTKIARGTIEIVSDVHLVIAGGRVDASQATLLNMLGISPFTYGMKIIQIFSEGQLFPESVLDVSDDELLARFMSGVTAVASISLALNYPTLASVMHSLVNSYKNLVAIALETEVSWPEVEAVKERALNPEAFVQVAAPAAAGGAAEETKAEKAPEPEEESDDDMGFGLFD
ncbi:60S acidic ribosomal protein P0 [Rhodotorula toruloides]|uniref:60S acidic ribosomal protein P0 n=1 Tax=Rhodotorula toruloides TaxID=5286 RepID=A0A511KB61_RHOTO|nr:60S acidic ribosomal protein P0 [Rhodotorula toruloides]